MIVAKRKAIKVRKKKRASSTIGIPLIVRADRSMIVALDQWIKKRKPRPSRSEALRILAQITLRGRPRKKPRDMDATSRAYAAFLLRNDALQFHKAGTALSQFGPKNFRLCQSIELAMKAYLMATGSTLDDVEDLGHDLKSCIRHHSTAMPSVLTSEPSTAALES